jgi:hypothetical protein
MKDETHIGFDESSFGYAKGKSTVPKLAIERAEFNSSIYIIIANLDDFSSVGKHAYIIIHYAFQMMSIYNMY